MPDSEDVFMCVTNGEANEETVKEDILKSLENAKKWEAEKFLIALMMQTGFMTMHA